ncbi:MAG: diversity-generating retroelement protein Avd [Chloroflexi bacterium]|nr:diversity-generating retroelement protein Avd [Ardenticatenaceae bacterium]NOG36811.1 diversity-generating retroelement protein Avd [Chloroflexota bacterium]
MKQSPIFVKQYDLMAWLIPCTLKFPKSQRGVLARQIQTELFRLHEGLVMAGTSDVPLPGLQQADRALIRLRTYLRLSRDLQLLSVGQFEHAARLADEVGKLLGGWQKTTKGL